MEVADGMRGEERRGEARTVDAVGHEFELLVEVFVVVVSLGYPWVSIKYRKEMEGSR